MVGALVSVSSLRIPLELHYDFRHSTPLGRGFLLHPLQQIQVLIMSHGENGEIEAGTICLLLTECESS